MARSRLCNPAAALWLTRRPAPASCAPCDGPPADTPPCPCPAQVGDAFGKLGPRTSRSVSTYVAGAGTGFACGWIVEAANLASNGGANAYKVRALCIIITSSLH